MAKQRVCMFCGEPMDPQDKGYLCWDCELHQEDVKLEKSAEAHLAEYGEELERAEAPEEYWVNFS